MKQIQLRTPKDIVERAAVTATTITPLEVRINFQRLRVWVRYSYGAGEAVTEIDMAMLSDNQKGVLERVALAALRTSNVVDVSDDYQG